MLQVAKPHTYLKHPLVTWHSTFQLQPLIFGPIGESVTPYRHRFHCTVLHFWEYLGEIFYFCLYRVEPYLHCYWCPHVARVPHTCCTHARAHVWCKYLHTCTQIPILPRSYNHYASRAPSTHAHLPTNMTLYNGGASLAYMHMPGTYIIYRSIIGHCTMVWLTSSRP